MSRTEYPKLGTEHPRTPLSTTNQWDNMGSQTQGKILCHQIPQKFNNRAQQSRGSRPTDNTSTDSAIKRKKNPDGMSQTNEDSRKKKGQRKKIRSRRTEGTRQQAKRRAEGKRYGEGGQKAPDSRQDRSLGSWRQAGRKQQGKRRQATKSSLFWEIR